MVPRAPRKAGGVLEPHVVPDSVPVSEVEESRPYEGRHVAARLEGRHPHARRFGVGEEEAFVVGRERHRLRERGVGRGAVRDILAPRARVRREPPLPQVEPPELVRSRHRDEEAVVVKQDVPRRAQVRGQRVAGTDPARSEAAGPGHRGYTPGLEVDHADRVVPAVGDDQHVPREREPLRFAETRLPEAPVFESRLAAPDHRPHLERVPQHVPVHDAVMAAVGHRDPALDVGGDLSGKQQRTGFRLDGLRPQRPRTSIHRSLPLVFLDQITQEIVQWLVRQLTGLLRDDIPLGIHDRDRRPCSHRVRAPEAKLPVVHDRMVDPLPAAGLGDRFCASLVMVLAGVDADRDQRLAERRLELPDPRQHVQAVDSAVGPEVEQDDPAAKILPGRRSHDVEPLEVFRKRRCADDLRAWHPHLEPGEPGSTSPRWNASM